MAQTYTDDCFASGHAAQTDMQNIENNFAALKSTFSGAAAPSDLVAGMWWFDTTANILKIRNEANNAWLNVWDLANNKPLVINVLIGDFPAAMKDPAVGTAGFRTLGSGAAQACPGNDARLSDQRTPTNNTVSTAKVVNDAITPAKFENGAVSIMNYPAQIGPVESVQTWEEALSFQLFIPTNATTLRLYCQVLGGGGADVKVKFKVGALTSGDDTAGGSVWENADCSLNVASLSGQQNASIWLYATGAPDAYGRYINFVWE